MDSKNKGVYFGVRIFLGGSILLLLWMLVGSIREIGTHPDKIWLHRCNSLEKLHEKQAAYPNVEIDLVFREDGRFDVTHDADTSFGLSLESYFSYMQGKSGKMWLDIKNLTVANQEQILNRLNELTERYGIAKSRLIVESACWQGLKLFTQQGYYTSLYVVYDKPSRLSEEEIEKDVKELRAIVDKKVVRAISFPGWWYAVLKEKLHRPIDLLTWKHRTWEWELLLSPVGRKMLQDPQLKVILVKDKGRYHR